jgi:hypothetical protein
MLSSLRLSIVQHTRLLDLRSSAHRTALARPVVACLELVFVLDRLVVLGDVSLFTAIAAYKTGRQDACRNQTNGPWPSGALWKNMLDLMR